MAYRNPGLAVDQDTEGSQDILEYAKNHCLTLLSESRCAALPFHNVEHTLEVFENTQLIGRHGEWSQDALEPVLLAALFHDVGNVWTFRGHEDRSGQEAKKVLEGWGYPQAKVALVLQCIEATRLPQRPQDRLGQMLCDADLFHLGSTAFTKKNDQLRAEWELFQNMRYTDSEWLQMNISFLEEQSFFTPYGKSVLAPVKQRNTELLREKLSQI
ncbi:HD domain-containing protein [Allomuricauda sp. NBRC 101325]|uniref:HD domain-containing protein n=1 Tax=Allomuricauda sp. NBRC 101325 TaxID=1113758 RepID=UPI0024A4C1B1|nr:HD domain-containing protein [Muricauda sp. NBRC 101325]GLU45169.1 hypothetical protein Musp01_27930 [Muricauda sp. NBRC 101325]